MSSDISTNPLVDALDKHADLQVFQETLRDKQILKVKYKHAGSYGDSEVYEFVLDDFYPDNTRLNKIAEQYRKFKSVIDVEATYEDEDVGRVDEETGNSIIRVVIQD